MKTHADKWNSFNEKEWTPCPVCAGLFVDRGAYKASGYSICAWCCSRGGRILVLFIKFVSQFADRACEHDVHGPADKCKCPPCTARVIMEYRWKRTLGQQAPPLVR